MLQGWSVERCTAWRAATIFVPPRARDAVAPHPAELARLFQRVGPLDGICLYGGQSVSATFEKLLQRQIDCFLDATNGNGGHIRCTYHDAAQTWRAIQTMESVATHAAVIAAGATNSDLYVQRAKMVT
jgi:hypothetical protein